MRKLIILVTLLTSPVMTSAQNHGPETGALFLAGGAVDDTTIVKRFVELAGGAEANIIIVPTASAEKNWEIPDLYDRLEQFMIRHGASTVSILHTRDPHQANLAEFLDSLKSATGVWFWGGRSARLVEAYAGTAFLDELAGVLRRGGVIGGTSAGAAILPALLLRGDQDDTDLIAPVAGFGLISGVAVDVHFLARNRLHPLSEFLASRPDLLGIGIDEDTALILRGNQFEVIGNSYVAVFGVAGRAEPLTLLSAGDQFDIVRRKIVGNCEAWSAGCVTH